MAKVTFRYQPPNGLITTEARSIEPPPEVKLNSPSKPTAPEPIDFSTDAKVDRWWYESSYDLRTGLDVIDNPQDTVPRALLDELFKDRRPDRVLGDKAQHWLDHLPKHVRPVELPKQFPRLVNRLAALWHDEGLTEQLLAELLTDARGGRQGFPPLVTAELELLYELHCR